MGHINKKNDKLQQWMPNLEVVDLRKSRKMKFNMNDGTGNSFEIAILDFQPQTYWQFEWGEALSGLNWSRPGMHVF